jgi:hypothetical protein
LEISKINSCDDHKRVDMNKYNNSNFNLKSFSSTINNDFLKLFC